MGFDMTIPAGCPAECGTKWAELKAAHDAIWQGLLRLDDAKVFPIVNAAGAALGSFTAAEFKFRFPRMTWKLVAKVPANGGVGATVSYPQPMTDYSKWTNADTFILPNGLIGYGLWGVQGYNYLSLHETAHTTMAGLKSTDDCWRDHHRHHDDTYQLGCSDWEKNERLANDIALIVAKALDIPIIGTPTAGTDVRTFAAVSRRPQTPAEIPLALLDIGPRTMPKKKRTAQKTPAKKKKAPARKSTGRKAARKKPRR
jgi:hypothetical protein